MPLLDVKRYFNSPNHQNGDVLEGDYDAEGADCYHGQETVPED